MGTVVLARLQFAITLCFHFLFPPLTIGIGLLLCGAEWLGWRRNDPDYQRMGEIFGRLLAINFAFGIATGVVMLFQFGTNWARYSAFVANIFGGPLATEAFFAFFLESTFFGVYLLGRNRLSKGAHWSSLVVVSVTAATLSAFFIVAANSWQQTPAGYVLHEGRPELTDLRAAILNPSTLPRYFHVLTASLISGAFVFAGVGALHALRDGRSGFAAKSLRFGVTAGLLFSFLQLAPFGHVHAEQVARTQPEKLAAIEGIYRTGTGIPLVLFGIPTTVQGRPELKATIAIPKLLSLLAFNDPNARVRGLDDFPPEDWPPLRLPFATYHLMVALGMLFIGLMALSTYRLLRGRLYTDRWLLKGLVWATPLPLIAVQLGWITAEVGRQPWVVYRLLRTADAPSPAVSARELGASLALFGLFYLLLFGAWLFLMIRTMAERSAPRNG